MQVSPIRDTILSFTLIYNEKCGFDLSVRSGGIMKFKLVSFMLCFFLGAFLFTSMPTNFSQPTWFGVEAHAKKKKKKKAEAQPATPTCAAMDAIDANSGKKKARKKKQKQKDALYSKLKALQKTWCTTKGQPYPYCSWSCGGGAQDEEVVPNNGNRSTATIDVNRARRAN